MNIKKKKIWEKPNINGLSEKNLTSTGSKTSDVEETKGVNTYGPPVAS